MNQHKDNCIVLFVKYPANGSVKTRLAEEIGQENATDIYRLFVIDILEKLEKTGLIFNIFFTPSDSEKKFKQWLGVEHTYIIQKGEDLGEKMKNAFQHCFGNNFSRVVIIGSDSPDLPAEYIEIALHALDTKGVVIGPSCDGGYYLIGFTREAFLPEAFEQISWSSNKVFDQTNKILKQHRKSVYLLPQWHDVDTISDLKSFLQRNENSAFSKSATISYLMRHKLRERFNV